ncbi:MAG: hypothetical protein ACE5JA_11455 [bacterium]
MCPAEEKESVSWTSFPAAEEKGKAVAVSILLLALFGVIYVSFGPLWMVISLLLLGGSVAPYFAVTRYRMTPEGIEAFHFFYTARRSWRYFRSYYEDKKGVLLSPFERPSRLENYRGLYLRFGTERDRVMDYIERRFKWKNTEQVEG